MSYEFEDEESFVRFLRELTGGTDSKIGDDCAIIDVVSPPLLATVDCMVSSVHFTPEATVDQLARKLIGINVSDIAAMGGLPRWALLVSSGQHPGCGKGELTESIVDSLKSKDVDLVGGDLSSTGQIDRNFHSLTLLGQGSDAGILTRDAVEPGDLVVVSGDLGTINAILSSSMEDTYRDRLYSPPDRTDLGQAAVRQGVTAAIDLSDGLIKDLRRLCEASGVGVTLDYREVPVGEVARELSRNDAEALKRSLDGGEDFELLMAVPPDRMDDLKSEARSVELSVIGRFHPRAGDEITWDPPLPDEINTGGFGYDHFS